MKKFQMVKLEERIAPSHWWRGCWGGSGRRGGSSGGRRGGSSRGRRGGTSRRGRGRWRRGGSS